MQRHRAALWIRAVPLIITKQTCKMVEIYQNEVKRCEFQRVLLSSTVSFFSGTQRPAV